MAKPTRKLPATILRGEQPPGREDDPPLPYNTRRPKRRRKGQLNDGEWAPGYGPDKKKR